MLLKEIEISNFRSIRHAHIRVGNQLALLGANGTGKSTVLRALDKFYGPNGTLEMDDFFNRRPVETVVALTFHDFSDDERERFASRIHDGTMTVARVFDPELGKNSGSYFGMTRQHEPFAALRRLQGATDRRNEYTRLRDLGGIYADLPATPRSAADLEPLLTQWESAHGDQCTLSRDDGRFFGFTNVANGALQRSTAFVFIPAVRDVSADATDSKGAVVAKLLELVVKNVIERREDFRQWKQRMSSEYREMTSPAALPELGNLSEELTSTLSAFYSESAVQLQWKPSEDFAVPLPVAEVQLDEDGFVGPVGRKGHGLQRAFILTLLQHLARAAAQAPGATPAPEQEGAEVHETERLDLPGLILAIEEPELYQHPTKQRHFARVLAELSSGAIPGVATKTQVLFASHSPLFVSLDRFEEIRLAKRVQAEGEGCKECRFVNTTLSTIAERLQRAAPDRRGNFTAESLKARLHIVDPELAEGFFADTVVLVEGPGDRAAILAATRHRNIDLTGMGVAVLSADGKNNVDRPYIIFRELGIPTYAVWDCDDDSQAHQTVNNALQRICGVSEEDLHARATLVLPAFSCFESKLEITLRAELGQELFDRCCAEIRAELGFAQNRDLLKSSFAVRELLTRAHSEGRHCATLDSIVDAIVSMRSQPRTADQTEVRA